jgi:hypothetical protein
MPWHVIAMTGKLGVIREFRKDCRARWCSRVGGPHGSAADVRNRVKRLKNVDKKGEILVVRRFVTLILSFCLVLAVGIMQVHQSFAQEEAKKETQPPKTESPAKEKEAPKTETPAKEAPKTETPAKEAPKTEASKTDTPKAEAPKATELPLPPIPPEVQAKIDAARKAVAEAIVAAQDAGLVETSIDPPPILDILVNGRATDARTLKNTTAKKPYAVSPEVFCAWFTGYGKLEGIDYVKDVRIQNPSAGLKQLYDQRAGILRHYMEEVRKAKGPAPTPKKEETKSDASPKPEEAKTDASKKTEEVKKP